MSVEELMKVRFILEHDYIGNTQPIGYIFTTHIPDYYRKYPANFRELHWWEHRQESEMPEYVKDKFSDEVFKLTNFLLNPLIIADLLPATEQQYLEYKTNTNG